MGHTRANRRPLGRTRATRDGISNAWGWALGTTRGPANRLWYRWYGAKPGSKLTRAGLLGYHPTMRYILPLVVFTTAAFGQAVPSITNVTNAAIPAMDYPPATISLAPRSMATIFGTNLADSTVSTAPPWSTTLGGTEVHLANATCFDSSCDLIGSMIFASPTQINFLVPDNGSTSCRNCTPTAYRIVLVRDGQRIDNRSYMLGGPGLLVIDPFDVADYNVVFQVGYDCLYSYSLSSPTSCGLSWSSGQNRAPSGAITDALSGQLISPQLPIHQGQVLTLWMTGMYGGVTLNNATGLFQETNPAPVGFGVAQLGTDIAPTISSGFDGPFGTFMSPTPIWAGESAQFVGLDQFNVAFPTCSNAPATTEKRYDAFLIYTSIATLTTVRIYLPFVVRVGDPDCQWSINTSTTLSSSANPSVAGQTVTFTVAVSSPTATGTVAFFDGGATLGNSALTSVAGKTTATFLTSTLSTGSHLITAKYDGNATYGSSTSAVLTQAVNAKINTTITITSTPTPGGVILTAIVSPSTASGTVNFIDNAGASCTTGCVPIGSATLEAQPTCTSSGGQCVGIFTVLSIGKHSIIATYGGNSSYDASSTLPITLSGTSITLTSNPNPSISGQAITFTATVSPSSATGTIELVGGAWTPPCDGKTACFPPPPIPIICSSYTLSSGQVTCTTTLSLGSDLVTVVYSGDSNFAGSASAVLTQTVTAR
jgi:uncharacterized protein (TIGR03437 family)